MLAVELFERAELQQGGRAMRTQSFVCIQDEQQSEELPHSGEPIGFLPIFFPLLLKRLRWEFPATC